MVNNDQAIFKGTGTINDQGNYNYIVSFIDGDITGDKTLDLFRIIIWDENDQVLYDNQNGDIDAARAVEQIGNGSLTIHKGCNEEEVTDSKNKNKAAEIATAPEPEFKYSDLKVYPNPFNDRVRFEFISPESVNAQITIYDMIGRKVETVFEGPVEGGVFYNCLLYTSDAADDLLCVDLGGRRIINK